MKIFTEAEVDAALNVPGGCLEKDNFGQLLIYTGIFEWKDGSFRSEPDPSYDQED